MIEQSFFCFSMEVEADLDEKTTSEKFLRRRVLLNKHFKLELLDKQHMIYI